MISGRRVQALQRRANRISGGFNKTVTLERVNYASGNSDYRPGTASKEFSVVASVPPVVHIVSEEDIHESGNRVSMGDYVFVWPGDMLPEHQMRAVNQIILNRGQKDQEFMQVVDVRIGGQLERFRGITGEDTLNVVGGRIIQWKMFARATKVAS